jgi:hypothetical protein
MEEEKKEKSFVIKDKRLFDESGDVRRNIDAAPEKKPAEAKDEPAPEPVRTEKEPSDVPEENFFPEVNFSNFVLSMSTTAMYHFGDFPDPASGKADRNMMAAKQTIDILAMLRSKTEGNLDDNEKSLLDGLLFELRMRYVKEKDSA